MVAVAGRLVVSGSQSVVEEEVADFYGEWQNSCLPWRLYMAITNIVMIRCVCRRLSAKLHVTPLQNCLGMANPDLIIYI